MRMFSTFARHAATRHAAGLVLVLLLLSSPGARADEVWQQMPGPGEGIVVSLVTDPASGKLLCGSQGGGVYASADGAAWTPVAANPDKHNDLLVPAAAGVYLATYDDVYFSSDGGGTWANLSDGAISRRGASIRSFAAGAKGALYAGCAAGGPKPHICCRPTPSAPWTVLTNVPNLGIGDAANIPVTMVFNGQDVLFVGFAGHGFYKYDGTTWTEIVKPLSCHMVIRGAGKELFLGHKGGIQRSDDDGGTWSDLPAAPKAATALAWAAEKLWAGTGGGELYESSDKGASFTRLAPIAGIAGPINTILVRDRLVCVGANNGAFRSGDGGKTWQKIAGGLIAPQRVDDMVLTPEGVLYTASRYSGVWKSADPSKADAWTSVNAGLNGAGIQTLVRDAKGNFAAAAYRPAGAGAFFLAKGGDKWQPANVKRALGLAVNKRGEFVLSTGGAGSIMISGDGVKYEGAAGGAQGFLVVNPVTGEIVDVSPEFGNMRVSADGGRTWTDMPRLPGAEVSEAGFNKAGELFVGHTGATQFSRFDKAEQKWVDSSSGLRRQVDNKVISLACAANGDLYAGTGKAEVYHSTDQGRSWKPFGSGLPRNVRVLSLAVDDAKGFLYAGLRDGAGLYRIPVDKAGEKVGDQSFHALAKASKERS